MENRIVGTALNNVLNITESTTLGELIEMMKLGEKPHDTPTPKQLRENAGDPIAEAEGALVYANGWTVYDNESGRTVIWLPDCVNFTYVFVKPRESEVGIVPEKEKLPEGFLDSQPWIIPVTLIGDHRVDDNVMNRSGSRTGTTDFNYADNGDKDGDAVAKVEAEYRKRYTWRDEEFGEDPLDIVIRKEEQQEQLACLTDKQKKVFTMYYKEGYTQQEIANEIGCVVSMVNKHLTKAIKKVKKIRR